MAEFLPAKNSWLIIPYFFSSLFILLFIDLRSDLGSSTLAPNASIPRYTLTLKEGIHIALNILLNAMKGVAIIGYKNSGKTSVAAALIRELKDRGYSVAALKHVHSKLKLGESDSTRLYDAGADLVIAAGPEETLEVGRHGLELWKALELTRAYDFLIVEGFKSAFPGSRIVAARSLEEAKKLAGPLVIAFSGVLASLHPEAKLPAPLIDAERDADKLADLVEKKSFEVPAGLNCGFCRYKSCMGLALAMASGEADISECVVLSSSVRLRVDGVEVALNPFVQKLVSNVVSGIVSSLKGVPPKYFRIEVVVERREE